MIALANKEIYHIGIGLEVTGDNEVKTKLTAVEKMTKQTEKKMKALDKVKASPSVRLKDKLSEPLQKIKGNLSRFKESASTEITALIGLGASAKAAMDFEKGMTKANTIAQLSKDKLNALSRETLGLSDDTGVAAKDLAEMEYNALSASVAIGDLTNVVKTSSTLSKGGFADANDSLKLLTSTYNVYREEFDKMGLSQTKASEMIADKMINIQNLGVTTVGELSTQLGNITPIAKNANMTLDELSAGMIVLTKNGLGTSEAVTGMKAALSNIIKPSEEARKMADALGLDFSTTAIKTKGFGGFLTDVRDKLKNANPALIEAADKVSKYQNMIDGASKGQKQNKTQMREWKEGLKGAKDELNVLTKSGGETTGALAQLFGSVEGLGAVLSLTSEYGMKDFQNGLEASKNSLGSTKKAADMMEETKAEKFEKAINKLKNMGIDLGLKLFPAIEKGIAFVSGLADKFNSFGPATQGFIINAGLAAVALKPFSGVLGGVAKGIGKLTTKSPKVYKLFSAFKGKKAVEETAKAAGGLKKLGLMGRLLPAIFSPAGAAIVTTAAVVGTAVAANASLMKKSVTTTTEELGPVEKIMNKLHGNINKSREEMIDLGLIYDDFGKGVSDNFKTAAQSASKSLLNLQMDIKRLIKDGTLDETEENKLESWITNLADESINALRQKHSEIKNEFEKTFNLDGTISDSEEKVLKSLSEYFETGVNKQSSIRDEIFKLGKDAIGKHGEELDSIMAQIREKTEDLKSIELEYTKANNAYESAYSQNQFKRDASKITGINGASELLEERAKEHQDKLDEIDNNYNGTIAYYNSLLSSSNISDEQRTNFENGLKDAEKVRDEALKQAEEAWQSDLETLYECYPKAKGMINEDTGKKFTDKDIVLQKDMNKMEQLHPDLAKIEESGVYSLQNSSTKALETLYVDFDKQSGKIKGILNETTGKIGSYSEEQKEKLSSLKDEYKSTGSAMEYLSTVQAHYDTDSGSIVNWANDSIGKLHDVRTAADGTVSGILMINNTPFEITSNIDGQIISMQEFKGSVDEIPPSANVEISTNASEATGPVDGLLGKLKSLCSKVWTAVIGTTESGSSDVHENANGTNFFKGGLSTFNERGWELSANKSVPILGSHNGNPLAYMSRGTKILNHMQSVRDMQKEVARQVDSKIAKQSAPQQIQYQVVQPQQQFQVAGVGGVNFGDVNVSVDGNQDIDNIVAQATQEFANNLKQALSNIKK